MFVTSKRVANCRLKFVPSAMSSLYTWTVFSGVASPIELAVVW